VDKEVHMRAERKPGAAERIRTRLTYANLMATLGVFLALGGTSYAALTITGRNVRNGSLTGRDVKNGSLGSADIGDRRLLAKDFKPGQLPSGPPGARGATGPAGPPGPLLATLPSGRTLRGVFGLFGHGTVDNGLAMVSSDISFAYPLASAPSVKVVQLGTDSAPPECPGTAASPDAAPGWLCVYENFAYNQRAAYPYPTVTAPGTGDADTATRYGASIVLMGQAGGTNWSFRSEGTWAVTAP
jgi:hypothetical protein